MKRPNEIRIDPENPWENDDLNRRQQGETLSRFIGTIQSSFVIALKAPWGAGKSTFLKRLEYHLEAHSAPRIPVIRLDAWRNDFVEDALIAFIGAIKARLDRTQGATKRKLGDFVSDFARIGGRLCAPIVGTAAKIFLPGSDLLVDFAKSLTDASTFLLEEQEKHEKTVQEFRDHLERARDLLTGRKSGEPIKPLVFMIDELDRCRPDFAIRALERIKHFFDVPGLIFLIATDGANLPAAVATVYGIHQDAERYLRKFIDYEFHLREPTPKEFVAYLCAEFATQDLIGPRTFTQVLEAVMQNHPEFVDDVQNKKFAMAEAIDVFPIVAQTFRLTLRDQIQAFTIITATIRAKPEGFVVLSRLLVLCVALRFVSAPIYEQLLSGSLTIHELAHDKTRTDTRLFQSAISEEPFRTYFAAVLHVTTPGVGDAMTYVSALIHQRTGHALAWLIPLQMHVRVLRFKKNYVQQMLSIASAFSA